MAQEAESGMPRYDNLSIRLHWITALLVLLLWCAGQTIDWFPRGAPRITVRGLHILFGVALGLILCWRIGWRATRGAHPPAVEPGVRGTIAQLMHWLLYLTLAATVALGVANTWVRGDNILGLFSVPAFDPGNRNLREQVEDLHSLFANGLLILAGLHAVAALLHHFVQKDGVLRRMWPSLR